MNLKFGLIFLLTVVFVFSLTACSHAPDERTEDVVTITDENLNKEVTISKIDFKEENKQIINSEGGKQLASRLLPDKSRIETLIDGFGNKTETRYFDDSPRLRIIVLQTAADGKQEVTIYGYGSEVKTLTDVGEKALTASANELADAAQLVATRSILPAKNFLNRTRIEPASTPLTYTAPTLRTSFPTTTKPAETVQTEQKPTDTVPDSKPENPDEN